MNAEINQNHGSGNWIAFLLGAIFNVLASINFNSLLEHALIALIGGVIWLLFQIIANRILKHDSKPKSNRRRNVKD
ncbi:hypothetical protein BH10BAC4_BH10BAC4_24860 [soil metagenome]